MGLWYDEVFEDKLRLGLKLKRTLFTGQSDFQKVEVVETELLGKALLIDGLWMTCEGEEAPYHELIVQPAMVTSPTIERVLIIGGGDGGTAREVLRHAEVKHVDMVEIDAMVIEACKEHLPEIGTAWDDPRLNVMVGDGVAYVKEADVEPYDVVIVDGSDPVGPAKGLFNESFYRGCARLLKEEGVFVTQSESPRLFKEIHLEMVQVINTVFGAAWPYYYPVMIYGSGHWSWTYASRQTTPYDLNDERVARLEKDSRIYNRGIHHGVFALPNHVKQELAEMLVKRDA
ncbi:MAG: spermidine synthase [Myxococcales bacterium]|nr:spermidine synthase [Myxococcales bacterium]